MVKTPEVTNSEFQQQVLNADLPVLVDFWAEKCGPGHTISPILEGLTEECDGKVKFVKIEDTGKLRHCRRYGVPSLPWRKLLPEG